MQDITVISFHEKFSQYDLGESHPFRGDRFENAIRFFKQQGILDRSDVSLIKPKSATKDDLLRVHSAEYVNRILKQAQESKPYDIETPLSPAILEAALLIDGGALTCGKFVMNGQASRGISLGGGHHHAGKAYGGGFCIFNDIAVLIEYLRAECGLKRFMVLDYDVHSGNGTSDIYYSDPSVLYVSLHQDPHTLYPGTGFIWQTGQDEGEGYNVNVSLPPGTSDETYLHALNEVFVPMIDEFQPDILIANGGSDSHFADSLGGLALTANVFFQIAKMIRIKADDDCQGKLVLIPGSGYNPKVLPQCWYALAAGIIGLDKINVVEPYKPPTEPAHIRKTVDKTLDELKRLLRKHWTCFGGYSLNTVP